ncbi:MAG: DNA primase [Burkholderiaceae bacterium]|nr:DNA primase [Burkholderiaceae bacterium]
MISQSFISELIDRVDVYDVVNRRVPLKDKGDRGWACCPFHNEKTSSFSVSRSKNFYHCFGCGAHGNAINFVMQYEGVDYPTAIERLAQDYGMTVRYDGQRKPNQDRIRLTDVMKAAQDYYRVCFNSQHGSEARQYCLERGLSPETIEKFAIGYSPDSWHGLTQSLKNIDPKYLKESGLQKEGKNGELYDFFRNRLMFPIRNSRGQTIAFSARTMCGENPKYINTGETPIFIKGQEVFGLYEGRQSIHDKGRVIVVEGQMDVIQLSQAGFGEACAPLGTAIKKEHIEKLLKLTDKIIFSFDGDEAGRKAAKRAMVLSLPLLSDKQKALFLFLPEGEDPDSFVKKQGKEAFESEILRAIPLSKFMLDSLSEDRDLKLAEDKASFLSEASPLVRSIGSDTVKNDIVRQIATMCGMELSFVNREFGLREVEVSTSLPTYRKNKRSDNKETSHSVFQPRIPAIDKNSPLLCVLRNFIQYPQLAVEYEKSATEMMISINNAVAKTVLKVISVITHEADDGFVFADRLRDIPEDAKGEQFERMIENNRNILLGLLEGIDESDLIREEVAKAHELNTPYICAKYEVELIFLQTEKNRLDVEIKQLIEKGLSDDSSRDRYRQLYQSRQRIVQNDKAIRTQLSKAITRDN